MKRRRLAKNSGEAFRRLKESDQESIRSLWRKFPFSGIATAIVTISMCTLCVAQDEEKAAPNVLFVSIDDLNDWIEPLGGHPQAYTPNLKEFAETAINFRRAYCASPGCNPSRTAVMTGHAPYRSGVYSNYQDWRSVLPRRTTIGEWFRTNGYFSAGAGKIFHYHQVEPDCWDEYWPSQEMNMPRELMPDKSQSMLPLVDGLAPSTMSMPSFDKMYGMFDWYAQSVEDHEMADAKSVDYVISQMKTARDQPFFLACGIYRPHLPWYVPEKYFELFPIDQVQRPVIREDDLADLGPRVVDLAHRGGGYHEHVLDADQWSEAVQGYLASIAFADAMFGRLMQGLEESGLSENTIVIVWSDHGWQLGEKEHWRKFALWENVLRSVLMIRVPNGFDTLPGGTLPNVNCDRVVSLQDIYPTLVELCGLPTNPAIDGRSLVPLLRQPNNEWPYAAISTYDYSEFSIRTERWRYTIYIDGSEELYDHDRDPEEWNNLATAPEFEAIKRELAEWIPHDPAPLKRTDERLQSHHIPPFRSFSDYQEWLDHDKDFGYLIDRYWSD